MQEKRRMILGAAVAIFGSAHIAGCAPLVRVPDDDVITARVKSVLGRAVPASAIDINVTTNEGVVRLSGPVTSVDAADRAVTAARSVDGVKVVHNDMHVAAVAR